MDKTTSNISSKSFFGHPIGLLSLLSTELCERFSYYGMRAILVYYIYDSVVSGGLGLDHTTAMVIMSLFGSLVYLASILGGWVADRLFGPYKGVLFGGIIIMAGHIVLGLPLGVPGLYISLLLIILGTGLLKPNVSVMVGELYDIDDHRRQSGFSLLVMSINVGSFFSPLIVGIVSISAGYNIAFLIPAFMMFIALLIYTIMGKETLKGIGRQPVAPLSAAEKHRFCIIVIAVIAGVVVLSLILSFMKLLNIDLLSDFMPLICTIISAILFYFIIRDKNITTVERSRVYAFIPIFLTASIFWAIAEQQSSTIALIADTRVNNVIGSFNIPPSWYASINPLVIILLSPLFAILWTRLGKKQPSSFAKMAMGLFLAFCGFVIFAFAFWHVGSNGQISPFWVIGGMTIVTIGELLLSPIGLSTTTLLSPSRHKSKMMSLWFISNALGQGVISLTVHFFNEDAPEGFYFSYALVALVIGLTLFLVRKKLLTLSKGIR